MKPAQTQQGFTLIELIVVIVILGILAATALPKFVDLTDDAVQAKADGVAGAISSGASIRYAGQLVAGASQSIADACDKTIVLQGAPAECSSTAGTCSGPGGTGTCTISCTDSGATKTASATVPCDG